MNTEINAIIEKNLPAQVGTVLKERLVLAEKDASALLDLKEKNKSQAEEISRISRIAQEHNSLDSRINELKIREDALVKAEQTHEVSVLKIQLAEAEKRADVVTEFTTGLVRNTSFRKTIFDSETQSPYQDVNGNMVYPNPVNKNFTETKEKE